MDFFFVVAFANDLLALSSGTSERLGQGGVRNTRE
jgi:hypothetical protein